MTTSLKSTISAQLGWTWRDQVATATVTSSNRLPFSKNMMDDDYLSQPGAVWYAEDQTLGAGESAIFTLDALDQNMFGDTITVPMSSVRAILIINKNEDAGDGYLSVGAAAVDGWSAPFGSAADTVKVMPDSPLLLANTVDGWDVESGSTDLEVTAVGGSVTFDVAVLGILGQQSQSSSGS